jgi:hypothetical protein
MDAGPTTGTQAVRGLFGLLGLAAGIVVGWQAYDRSGSIALGVFLGLLLANYIARGVGDIVTDPEKGKRLVFFTLPVLISLGGLAGTYLLWERWWLAVTLGVVAYLIGLFIVTLMLPKIAAEEAEDDRVRTGIQHRSPSSASALPTNPAWPGANTPLQGRPGKGF